MSQINCFERYSAKVFNFDSFLSLLKDNRNNPGIDLKNIVLGYYYGSALRIKATSAIEEEIREGVLRKRVKDVSDDTIGYGLNNLEPRSVQQGWYMLARKARRNGMLRGNPFHDYMVGVLDGIETYSSYKRHCARCLTRKIQTSKGERIQYYHREVVLILVGYRFPIPLGMEMMRRGENESNCALRLLKRIVDNLGTRFLDIVIGDAHYCTPNFSKRCEELNIYVGAVLKENQENLLESARSGLQPAALAIKNASDKEKLKVWDLNEVYWDTADEEVRVIWAEREVWELDESSDDGSFHWAEKRNVFAFSKRIDALPSDIVYSIGRHRWDIDAKLFMDMVKHWHLKHKTLHFSNAYENMLSIRLISYFIFMFFFHRHINSRRKKKIESYIKMARMLYRTACVHLAPEILLLE
jgi:hypothetical protein